MTPIESVLTAAEYQDYIRGHDSLLTIIERLAAEIVRLRNLTCPETEKQVVRAQVAESEVSRLTADLKRAEAAYRIAQAWIKEAREDVRAAYERRNQDDDCTEALQRIIARWEAAEKGLPSVAECVSHPCGHCGECFECKVNNCPPSDEGGGGRP